MRFQKEVIALDPEFPLKIFPAPGCGRENFFLHTHDCLEINLVAQGEGIYWIGNKQYNISQGDLVIINNREHHIAVNGGNLLLKVLVFDPDMVWQNNNTLDYKYLQTFYEWKLGFPPCFSASHPLTEAITSVFSRIEREIAEQQEGCRLLVKALLLEILSLIYRAFAQSDHTSQRVQKFRREYARIEKSLLYLDNRYRESVRLHELAGLVHLTPSYYSKLFHEVTGMTVPVYVSQKRLRHACLLLKTSEKNISEIALECGFNDVSSFNRLFRRTFALSPSEYRTRR